MPANPHEINDVFERKYIRRHGLASHMSTSKWLKLIVLLKQNPTLPSEAELFYLGSERGCETNAASWWMPVWGYVEADRFPPVSLLAIERLSFPRIWKPPYRRNIPGTWKTQDLERLRDAIMRLSHYPLSLSEHGLDLIAHGRLPGDDDAMIEH